MKTLELKDLKYYLETGLRLQSNTVRNGRIPIEVEMYADNIQQVVNGYYTPAFYPVSALTEQLPDGSIPIVVLAKMALMYQTDFEVYGFEKQYIDGEFIVAESDMSMRFIFDGKSFWMQNGYGNINVANNQLQLFEYLYQNHFWLGDQSLFETGEIIDKRSLK